MSTQKRSQSKPHQATIKSKEKQARFNKDIGVRKINSRSDSFNNKGIFPFKQRAPTSHKIIPSQSEILHQHRLSLDGNIASSNSVLAQDNLKPYQKVNQYEEFKIQQQKKQTPQKQRNLNKSQKETKLIDYLNQVSNINIQSGFSINKVKLPKLEETHKTNTKLASNSNQNNQILLPNRVEQRVHSFDSRAPGVITLTNQSPSRQKSRNQSVSDLYQLKQKPQVSNFVTVPKITSIAQNHLNALAQMQNQSQNNQTAYIIPNVMQSIAKKTKTGQISNRPKKNNQDNHFEIFDFVEQKNMIFLSVMDGHGIHGHDVSDYIKRNLPYHIENLIPQKVKKAGYPYEEQEKEILKKCITEGFKKTNQELNNGQIDVSFSGSTCVTVMIRGSLLICSNVGDSRAIMCRKAQNSWQSIALSRDHKPDDKQEQARIIKNGGRVDPFKGPARVWLKNENAPGLAMSRSLGDAVAAQVGVISEPGIYFYLEILEFEITPDDKFIVLASDGVWEFIDNDEVRNQIQCMRMIIPFYEQNNAMAGCDKIVKESVAHWKRVRINNLGR